MADVESKDSLEDRGRPTIHVDRRTNRSLYMFALQHCLKPFSAWLVKSKPALSEGSQPCEPHKKAKKWCNITERKVEEVYMYDMTPKEQWRQAIGEKSRRRRIFYFAGGGWQMLPSSEHWVICAEMARKLPNTVVTMVSYPLAPNSPAPIAIPILMKWYHTILRECEEAKETVVFMGDSAGGNIVLCLPLTALAENEDARCPAAIMAISPSTDLCRLNPDIKLIEKHDPILRIPFINGTAKGWRGEWDPVDVKISPLYADVSLLARRHVKVHGVVGRYDILSPDAILFREKCNQAGVRGEWLEWQKQMHVFPLTWAFKLPEGVQAKNWMLEVLEGT